jgi:hypothetical protein
MLVFLAKRRDLMGLRGQTTLLGLVLVLLLFAGCGGSGDPRTGTHYTLHVEVTSSPSPIAFSGSVSPNNGQEVPISGTTPFVVEIRDKEASCGQGFVTDPQCFTRVSATVKKLTKTDDLLTLCVRNGDRHCNSTTAFTDSTSVDLAF